VAERLRTAVSDMQLAVEEGRTLAVTASFGVATSCAGAAYPTAEAMIGAADQALYAAKEGGRNCVRLHEPVQPSADDRAA
jgi:diguanylate cyclase (GGDEF)-like protein